jgi:hypothetical protein
MIPIRKSTIFHHPSGHQRGRNIPGEAETETLCCMVRSKFAVRRCYRVVIISLETC